MSTIINKCLTQSLSYYNYPMLDYHDYNCNSISISTGTKARVQQFFPLVFFPYHALPIVMV